MPGGATGSWPFGAATATSGLDAIGFSFSVPVGGAASTDLVGIGVPNGTLAKAKLEVRVNDSNTNAIIDLLALTLESTGNPANNIGVNIPVYIENASHNVRKVGQFFHRMTDVTDTSEDSYWEFDAMVAGSITMGLQVYGGQTLVPAGTDTAPGIAVGAANYGWTQNAGNTQLRAILAGAVSAFHNTNGITINAASGGGFYPTNAGDVGFVASVVGGSARKGHLNCSAGVVIGGAAALATGATSGFLWLPTMAGTPTGAPDTTTGKEAAVVDTTASKLWIRFGATWKSVTLA